MIRVKKMSVSGCNDYVSLDYTVHPRNILYNITELIVKEHGAPTTINIREYRTANSVNTIGIFRYY